MSDTNAPADSTTFEVWEFDAAGPTRRVHPQEIYSVALSFAKAYNEEEEDNAIQEMRIRRRWFYAVEATTTRKVLYH